MNSSAVMILIQGVLFSFLIKHVSSRWLLGPGILAIIAGLIPTSLGLGIGGQGRAAIAVTVIGGQSLCLFLTLLLVPVAYVKFDALEQVALNRQWKDVIVRAKAAVRMRPAPAD